MQREGSGARGEIQLKGFQVGTDLWDLAVRVGKHLLPDLAGFQFQRQAGVAQSEHDENARDHSVLADHGDEGLIPEGIRACLPARAEVIDGRDEFGALIHAVGRSQEDVEVCEAPAPNDEGEGTAGNPTTKCIILHISAYFCIFLHTFSA